MTTNNDPITASWKTFQASFKEANSNPNRDYIGITDNNIKLIDTILGRFMDPKDWIKTQQDASKIENKTGNPVLPSYNVRTPHVDVWINGVMVIKQGQTDNIQVTTTPTTPSNNTTTSNTTTPPDEFSLPSLDVLFKDMNLDMAFGGPLGTIRGTMSLFSRDPLDFLSFLYDFTSNLESADGLPTLSVRFGWNIASPQGDNSNPRGSTLLTPKIDFLVMNVAMTDPSVEHQGSIFTLTLQDTGSAIYENTSADFAIVGDYPQNQLRLLLERGLGIRLLTLDDFMGDAQDSIPDNPDFNQLDPKDSQDLLILNALANKLQSEEQKTTGSITGLTKNGVTITTSNSLQGSTVVNASAATEVSLTDSALPYLSKATKLQLVKNYLVVTGAHERDFGWQSIGHEVSAKKHEQDLQVLRFIRDLKSSSNQYIALFMNTHYNDDPSYSQFRDSEMWAAENPDGATSWFLHPFSYDGAINWLVDWVDLHEGPLTALSILDDVCSFIIRNNGPTFPLGTVNPSLRTDVIKIFSDGSATTKEETPSVVAIIKRYADKDAGYVSNTLKTIYSESPSLFTKTFFLNDQHPPLRMNSGAIKDTIEALVSKIQCRWYPVSNSKMAKELSSPSSDAYVAYKNFKAAVDSGKSEEVISTLKKQYEEARIRKSYSCRLLYVSGVPKNIISKYSYVKDTDWTDGAFILIPNVNPLHIVDDEVPLIYGPGGSSYPYLYGGAQNVKQVLLDKAGQLPKMYGEIIDAKVNFNTMTALIAGNFNEEAAIAEAGTRMSRLTSTPVSVKATKTPEQKAKERDERKKQLEEILKKDPRYNTSTAALLQDAVDKLMAIHDRERKKSASLARFATNYQGNRTVYLADPINTPAADRTYTNPRRAQDAAADFLAQRLGNLLYSATSISMAVMGDPFLVRQGIGAFELLHYFIDREGTGLRYNYLLSGVYLVQSINHSISQGRYITNIKAFKIPPVNNSFSNTVDGWRRAASKKDANGNRLNPSEEQAMEDLLNRSLNLETDNITDTATHPTTATRIVKGVTSNTEIGNPDIIKDINKFYFKIGN